MFRFSRAKSAVIWLARSLGVLMSLPNIVPRGVLPAWVPQPRFNLGLDLQGDAYPLLRVDTDAMVRERMEGMVDTVRPALRRANVSYRDLGASGRSVAVTVPDPNNRDAARGALQTLTKGTEPGLRDYEVTEDGATLRLTITDEAVRLREASASLDSRDNEWVVGFVFDDAGAKRFAEIAKANVDRRFAVATIVDSNLTTLIKMLSLYIVGTGAVRGFAATISLGIVTSMFTATIVARWLAAAWFHTTRPETLPVERRFRLVPDDTRIPFMKGRNLGLIFSCLLGLASIGLFLHPGLNYGVDFAGGTVIEAGADRPVDFATARERLSGLGIGQVAPRQFGAPEDVLIRVERQAGGEAAQQAAVQSVREALKKDMPGTSIRRAESVGSSVGAELFQSGMTALGLAAIAMLIYITFRFEWPFGVGAVVTMAFDVTKTVGFFALTGMRFNLAAAAAILAIMGYSINDKVVICDRVRENLKTRRTMPLRELIDLSINETLGRTFGTSLAVFLSIIPPALLGGESLREFSLVLMFGVALATSSSIFVAAPILFHLGEHRLRRGPAPEGDPSSEAEKAPAD